MDLIKQEDQGEFQPEKMPNEYARAVHELVQRRSSSVRPSLSYSPPPPTPPHPHLSPRPPPLPPPPPSITPIPSSAAPLHPPPPTTPPPPWLLWLWLRVPVLWLCLPEAYPYYGDPYRPYYGYYGYGWRY